LSAMAAEEANHPFGLLKRLNQALSRMRSKHR
jgi:hypothetical protein